MNGFLLFIFLLNAYLLLVFILVKTGWMQRLNMSLFGPALMLRTERGRGLLDWFARARGLFDKSAGFGIGLTAVIMLLMSLLLVVQLFFIFQIPPEAAPSPRYILGIPGINPVIPVGFGIVAMIFAVVVHEFSHGILARVYDLKVKTMGILLLIVPIGAFVEPDEDELRATTRSRRVRVFAAGPVSNLFFALVFGLLFSGVLMNMAEPVAGVPIQSVIQDGPADLAGLEPGQIILNVNGTPVASRNDFSRALANVTPGTTVHMAVYDGAGTHAVTTVPCTALYNVSECQDQFSAFSTGTRNRAILRCEELYSRAECEERFAAFDNDPANRTLVGISVYPTDLVHSWLVNPISDGRAALLYVSLPFEAIRGTFPLVGIYQEFYEAPFHPPTFWFLVNLCYWLFWINLMLGLTNALPIVPLDGGHIFKDFVGAFVDGWGPERVRERRELIVRRTATWVALLLVSLVLMQFVGPYLAGLF